MVFVEESDEKVLGCISLDSVICKPIELRQGDNAGQGVSYLLPPEEEARIVDAIRAWEEQGESNGEKLKEQVNEEPTELDTLQDAALGDAQGDQDTPQVCVYSGLLLSIHTLSSCAATTRPPPPAAAA
jgi:hypothetical protein